MNRPVVGVAIECDDCVSDWYQDHIGGIPVWASVDDARSELTGWQIGTTDHPGDLCPACQIKRVCWTEGHHYTAQPVHREGPLAGAWFECTRCGLRVWVRTDITHG